VIVGHANCRDGLLADWREAVAALQVADWLPAEERVHFDEVEVAAPTLVFDERTGLWAGGRRLELAYLGRGHTDGDIVITVDDVTFAGDLVEEGAPPYFGDGFPRDWAGTLRVMAEAISGVVVPGHGDTVDRQFVLAQADEIEAAVDGRATSFPEATLADIRRRL
jgi:glyoxylase-like metal-dependent hydrolase (beta-lactamase superfamily II)